MGTLGKIVGAASVVTGAVGAVVVSGVTAQRRAVRRYRELTASPDIPYDTLTADRSYSVASADGVALHVEEVGPADAPLTVVFAHGWTLRLGAWHYQRIGLAGPGFGDPTAGDTASQARLVFFDQRSHGSSGRAGAGRSTMVAIADDLAAVIGTAAPSGPIVIVGHSLGGMGLLGLAAADPALFRERVAGIALIDSSARYGSEKGSRAPLLGGNPVVRAVTATASRYPQLFERGRPATREAVWLLTRSFGFAGHDVPTHLVDYVDGMISATPVEVIADFLPVIIGHDVTAGLPVLAELPAVVICGEADKITPPVQSRALAAALPLAELTIVPGAGHNVMLEQPAVTNTALRELLQRADVRASAIRSSGRKAGARAQPSGRAQNVSGQLRAQLELPEPENTLALGAAIGRRLLAGDLVLLSGDLGAGKTALTKGIAVGMGITDTITSPTFVLARVHHGNLDGRQTTLVHVDAYRLGGAPELDDLDLDTDLERAVVVIEWGAGIAGALAPDPLHINLIRHHDDSRTATLTAAGDRWRLLLEEVTIVG